MGSGAVAPGVGAPVMASGYSQYGQQDRYDAVPVGGAAPMGMNGGGGMAGVGNDFWAEVSGGAGLHGRQRSWRILMVYLFSSHTCFSRSVLVIDATVDGDKLELERDAGCDSTGSTGACGQFGEYSGRMPRRYHLSSNPHPAPPVPTRYHAQQHRRSRDRRSDRLDPSTHRCQQEQDSSAQQARQG